jgi:two-component sensor histidine kinase
MKEYTTMLSLKLQEIHQSSTKIEYQIKMDKIRIDINQAIPLGLILNELITNALKHAFPKKSNGKITIAIKHFNDRSYEVFVRDNGVGLSEAIHFEKTNTLGLKLIKILTEQLDGHIKIRRIGGTKVTINLPYEKK